MQGHLLKEILFLFVSILILLLKLFYGKGKFRSKIWSAKFLISKIELKDCQKDLKTRSEIMLRKDQQLEKLNATMKKTEKRLQEMNLQNKQLKEHNKKFEQENKKLVEGNEELVSKIEGFKKKAQDTTAELLIFKENLDTATHTKSILESEIHKLQKKYEKSLQNETELRKSLEIITETVQTQTDIKEFVSTACMTIPSNDVSKTINKSSLQNLKEDATSINTNISYKAEGDVWYQKYGLKKDETFGKVKHILSSSTKTSEVYNDCGVPTKAIKSHSLQPIHSKIISCPDAIKTDCVENRMNSIFVSEKEVDCNFSFSSSSGCYVLNERQKPKRLFSNFTVQQ